MGAVELTRIGRDSNDDSHHAQTCGAWDVFCRSDLNAMTGISKCFVMLTEIR